MEKIEVHLMLERETSGALRYQECTKEGSSITQNMPNCVIGTLYLRKLGIKNQKVGRLKITIEEVK